MACVVNAAVCAPYTPATKNEVVERLPSREKIAELRTANRLKKQLTLSPDNDEIALELAKAYFDAAMAVGDPRYLGYAKAVFDTRLSKHQTDARWWFTSGLLKQYGHDFPGAFANFDRALTIEPSHADSIAWKAALYMVEGYYEKAQQNCEQLRQFSQALAYSGCINFAKAGLGQLSASYAALADAFQVAIASKQPPSAGMRVWILVRLAEMAERLGKPELAHQHYDSALSQGVTDQYLLAAYADFLITQNKYKDVLKLLADWEASDVLLLRLAIAAQAVDRYALDKYRSELRGRFEAAAQRGDRLHEQEEARFLLLIENKPREALERAQHNYIVQFQREPRDAEMLLLAALATKNMAAAQPVLTWIKSTGFEDARLTPLLKKLNP